MTVRLTPAQQAGELMALVGLSIDHQADELVDTINEMPPERCQQVLFAAVCMYAGLMEAIADARGETPRATLQRTALIAQQTYSEKEINDG